MEAKNRRVVDGMKSRREQVRQTIKKQPKTAEQPTDVFELLNDKLNKTRNAEEQKDDVKDMEKLQVNRFLNHHKSIYWLILNVAFF